MPRSPRARRQSGLVLELAQQGLHAKRVRYLTVGGLPRSAEVQRSHRLVQPVLLPLPCRPIAARHRPPGEVRRGLGPLLFGHLRLEPDRRENPHQPAKAPLRVHPDPDPSPAGRHAPEHPALRLMIEIERLNPFAPPDDLALFAIFLLREVRSRSGTC